MAVMPSQHDGCITTFYSYKGGVGRTMVLANVAVTLARWGHRVLCVDGDLEAPGLHYYLQTSRASAPRPGFLELIQSFSGQTSLDWRDAITPISLDAQDRIRLDLVQAGLADDSYKERLRSLDLAGLYVHQGLGERLEHLCRDWREQYDHILIDSRTGITDIGGIMAIHLPDQLALLCVLNRQGLDGLDDVAAAINRARSNLPLDRPRLPILPLVTSYAGRFEVDLGDEWSRRFEHSLGALYDDWIDRDASRSRLIYDTRVPYVPKWSFGEQLPVLHEDHEDVDSISFALVNIASLIAHRLSDSALLLTNRSSYLRSSTRRAITDGVLRSLEDDVRRAQSLEDKLDAAKALYASAKYKKSIGETASSAVDYLRASSAFDEAGHNEMAPV